MTSTHDLQGRPYAKLSQLKIGDKVVVDDGFDCMKPWKVRTVWGNHSGLWLRCAGPIEDDDMLSNGPGQRSLSERHMLDGQLQDDGDTLIGIYRKEDFSGR